MQERVEDWKKRFGSSLGLSCRELTGDTDAMTDAEHLAAADIICTTPEKFGERHERCTKHIVVRIHPGLAQQ